MLRQQADSTGVILLLCARRISTLLVSRGRKSLATASFHRILRQSHQASMPRSTGSARGGWAKAIGHLQLFPGHSLEGIDAETFCTIYSASPALRVSEARSGGPCTLRARANASLIGA